MALSDPTRDQGDPAPTRALTDEDLRSMVNRLPSTFLGQRLAQDVLEARRERDDMVNLARETAQQLGHCQEDILCDLRAFCRAVGEFDGARPESPHAVMLACIRRAADYRQRADDAEREIEGIAASVGSTRETLYHDLAGLQMEADRAERLVAAGERAFRNAQHGACCEYWADEQEADCDCGLANDRAAWRNAVNGQVAPTPDVPGDLGRVCDVFQEWSGAPDVCGRCILRRSGHASVEGPV